MTQVHPHAVGRRGHHPVRLGVSCVSSVEDVRVRAVLIGSDTIVAESFQSDSLSAPEKAIGGRITAFGALSILQRNASISHVSATSINLRFRQLRRTLGKCGRIRRGQSMSHGVSHYTARGADRTRLQRARALLEMFEEDRGRRATSTEELREWIARHDIGQLRIRMNRRLHGIVVR
jgi:hypothetical protein